MCLQFPDHLLHEAAPVARELQQRLGQVHTFILFMAIMIMIVIMIVKVNDYDDDKENLVQDVFILGDTTFGACCVDEVTIIIIITNH